MNSIDKNKTYGIFANTVGRIIEARIENVGGNVINISVPSYENIVLPESHHQILGHLSESDWLIFTNILSARYFIETITAIPAALSELDSLRIVAVARMSSLLEEF